MPDPDTGQLFATALARMDPAQPVLVLTHHDADGLSAGALLRRALERAGRRVAVRVLGRGESAWSDQVRAEVAARQAGGVIVADLGVAEGAILPILPTIVIDHHVPRGVPGDALVLSGFGEDPIPTTSLLALRCAEAVAAVDDLRWLAAVGLLGDLGDKAPFAELAQAKAAHTATALKEVVALVNAPRRTAGGDAAPALALLLAAKDPKDALRGGHPEVALLEAARAEVKAAVEAGKRVPPVLRGDVALVVLHSPCQVHTLVAQAWRLRLRDKLVIVANTGYRAGWIHFALRSATGRDLVAFLRDHAPPGADENYGGGHREATGGALRPADWALFLAGLGFEPPPQA